MDAPGISKLSDGVVTLTFFASSDAAVLFEADGDAEHRRRFDFPDDFVPSMTLCPRSSTPRTSSLDGNENA